MQDRRAALHVGGTAEVRTALGLAPGDQWHLHLEGRRVVLERQQDATAEPRGLALSVPRARYPVDELLAERRLAAATSLVGRTGTHVTELVYRHELRPVIQSGGTAMDGLFTADRHGAEDA